MHARFAPQNYACRDKVRTISDRTCLALLQINCCQKTSPKITMVVMRPLTTAVGAVVASACIDASIKINDAFDDLKNSAIEKA